VFGPVTAPVSSVLVPLVDALLPAGPGVSPGPDYPAASAVGVDRDLAALVAGLSELHRKEFASLLRALDNPVANLLLSGRPVRFGRLDPAGRARYLRAWSESRLTLKRKGFQAVKRLASALYYSRPVGEGSHPLWFRIHYRPPDAPGGPSAPEIARPPVTVPDAPVDVSADVCVIGSGAGGSLIAARLAQAHYRVVILEAGAWVDPASYPRVERDGYDRLYVGRGVVPTRDSAISILAGRTVGGGTSVNWMTCLPPRPAARREWAGWGGMKAAEGPDFDRAYASVAARLEVSTAESIVNASNEALRRGCVALGYRQGPDWGVIARNAVGCRSRCGFCTFGCPYVARRSTLPTYLADAMQSGARLYASTRADRIDVEGGRVRGVGGIAESDGRQIPVRVRTPTVVVAAGALETPALLLRSGIGSPGVGIGLRLDPTTALAAEFPSPVRTWEGPPQTIGVYKFQSVDADDHGPWIETAPAHPGLSATAVPWRDPRDHRRLLERLEYVATPIVLVRDVAEGRVTIDREGSPVFDYVLDRRDRQNLVRGMVETARILRAAGATRLLSLHTPYIEVGDGARSVSEHELERFVEGVRHAGVREHAIALFSAHPMGSARAGTDPRRSAARPTGELHGVDGVWIGDGSLLPSAPGANPMMSIFATAELTAASILQGLAARSPAP
jgi:choline dehydrogenase-like flavoprotein